MVVDLHAHPAFKSEWFGFDIVSTSDKKSLVDFFTVDQLCFNPLVVRSDFDKGGEKNGNCHCCSE